MRPGLHVLKDDLPKLTKALEKLTEKQVMVGFPGETTERRPEPGEERQDITNASLGYIHDTGAPEVGIPARPFMDEGVENAKADIVKGFEKAGKAALDGQTEEIDRQLNIIGLKTQASVRAKINSGPFQPLAPLTIAKRRAKGRTSDKPLIDTAQMRNAVNYVIRKVRGIK